MPFAILGLPAYLALFTAFGFALARLIWTGTRRGYWRSRRLTIGEWLRGHVLSGFPWNAFGYALSEPLALAQTASLIGLWGLTFLTVAIFASPAVLIDGRSRGRKPWIAPVMALLLLVAMGVYGAVRLVLQPTRGHQRQAANHAAQSAAGRPLQLRRQGGGDAKIPDALGPRFRAAIHRRARSHIRSGRNRHSRFS